MSRDEMLFVIAVRAHGAAAVYVRPHDCLRAVAELLSVLSAGTTVHLLLDDARTRIEWTAVATGKPCAWIVDENRRSDASGIPSA